MLTPIEASQGTGNVITVTGHERLAWDQLAVSALDLARLEHIVHLDGRPVSVNDVTCASTPGEAGYECSAPLPALTPGEHELSVATQVRGGDPAARAMSTAIRVRMGSTATSPATADNRTASAAASIGRYSHAPVAAVEGRVVDLAALPDGRVLVAEREGRVLVLVNGRLEDARASIAPLDSAEDASELLAIAADHRFTESRHVFALVRWGLRAGIVRFTEAAGRLVNRATLLDGLPWTSGASASLRVGADGKLYAALPGAGGSRGQILRLNADGTTPRDHAAPSPVIAEGLADPTALDAGSLLWLAGRAADGTRRLRAIQYDAASGSSHVVREYALPAALGRVRLASTDDRPAANSDDLLIAGDAGLLRVRFDAAHAAAMIEWIMPGEFDSVRALQRMPDGSLMIATASHLFRIELDEP